MQHSVYRYRVVRGDFTTLVERLRAELPELLACAVHQPPYPPRGDGSVMIQLPAHVMGADVHKYVRVELGVERSRELSTVLPVRWRADPFPHLFPTFDGAVELAPQSRHRTQLSLVGAYIPPAGLLGAALDATLFHRVAGRTIEAVVDGLATALTDTAATPTAPVDRALVHVGDVMTRRPLLLDEELPLRSAALVLVHYKITGAPVVDEDGQLVGVLSESDLLEKEAAPRVGVGTAARRFERMRRAQTVGNACSRPAHVTSPDATAHDAAREMLDRGIARLIVLDEGQVVGILTRHDVLKVLVRDDLRILEAAYSVLVDLGEPWVSVDVEWGRISAVGRVSLLSRVRLVTERLHAVDGAMDVDVDGLTWEYDDVTYLAPQL